MAFDIKLPLDTGIVLRVERNRNSFPKSSSYADAKGLGFVTGRNRRIAGWYLSKSATSDPHICSEANFIECKLHKGMLGVAFVFSETNSCSYSIGIKASRHLGHGVDYLSNIGVYDLGKKENDTNDEEFPPDFSLIESAYNYEGLMIPYISGIINPKYSLYLDTCEINFSNESRQFAEALGFQGAIQRAEEFEANNLPYRTLLRTFYIPKTQQFGKVDVEILVWISGPEYDIETYMDVIPNKYNLTFDFDSP